ncbi:MAG: 30S ribosomal protein S7 [Anaerolineae bacterium SG8_19]|jgi:small subunit ribosomal protein S7|nr:MAG: 30S ribosomal protein S7 [Anaerolineae bacterium SG8_19]
MPRRYRPEKRKIAPDLKYNNVTLQMFINRMMKGGKKSTAQRIIYDALDIVEERTKKAPIEVFDQAVQTVTPQIEVKPRRVGGATYQVPMEVPYHRRTSLAIRWLLMAARSRGGRSMAEKLAAEIMDAANGQGAAVKRKEDTHRMAEANRAFAHYRF